MIEYTAYAQEASAYVQAANEVYLPGDAFSHKELSEISAALFAQVQQAEPVGGYSDLPKRLKRVAEGYYRHR